VVNDALFYLSNNAANFINLGLCQGKNYNGGFFNAQQRNGPFRSGNSGNFFVTCGATDNYAGTAAVTLDTDFEWSRRSNPANAGTGVYNNGNVTGARPANVDDCARLCFWVAQEQNTVPTGSTVTPYTTTCNAWSWVGTAFDTGSCFLYSAVNTGGNPAQIVNRNNGNGVFAAGGRTGGNTQSTGVQTWKRSVSEGKVIGRYNRDIWLEEREEDWMKPDLILRAADYAF
jgi:hypothetical protein